MLIPDCKLKELTRICIIIIHIWIISVPLRGPFLENPAILLEWIYGFSPLNSSIMFLYLMILFFHFQNSYFKCLEQNKQPNGPGSYRETPARNGRPLVWNRAWYSTLTEFFGGTPRKKNRFKECLTLLPGLIRLTPFLLIAIKRLSGKFGSVLC